MKNNVKLMLSVAAAVICVAVLFCFTSCKDVEKPADTDAVTTPSTTEKTVPEPKIVAVAGITMSGEELTADAGSEESFIVDGKIKVSEGAEWEIFRDENCADPVGSKTVTLMIGETVYWIRLTAGDRSSVYKLTVTRQEAPETTEQQVTTVPEDTTKGETVISTTPETPFTVTDRGVGDEVDFPG